MTLPDPEPRRALVVVAEDDPEMRQLVVRALRKDHEVEEVADGAALLSRLGRGPSPALVITDLRMPWLDGLEALRRVGPRRWVPAILVTAFPDAATRERAKAGDVELLPKPFDLDDLRTLARRLLASLGPWAEPEHDGYDPIRPR